MLGLGSSCNNEEGYAKGERYRERFHAGGAYDAATNPIGRDGQESRYIGDFTTSTDDDNYTLTDAVVGIVSSTFRIRATATPGIATIAVSVVP